jgi:hypothetical protein
VRLLPYWISTKEGEVDDMEVDDMEVDDMEGDEI